MLEAATYKEIYKHEFDALVERMDTNENYRMQLAEFIKKHGVAAIPADKQKNLPKDLRELYIGPWKQDKKVVAKIKAAAKASAKSTMMQIKLNNEYKDNTDIHALEWPAFAKKYGFDDYAKMSDADLRSKVMYRYFMQIKVARVNAIKRELEDSKKVASEES